MTNRTFDSDETYLIDGSVLNRLMDIASQLNSMSGQQLTGKGDVVRNLSQEIHAKLESHAEAWSD